MRSCIETVSIAVAATLILAAAAPRSLAVTGRDEQRATLTGPSFSRIAEIYPITDQPFVFGDTDHDGRNEVIFFVKENANDEVHYRILEEQGGNVYTDELRGDAARPFATGDLDRDGLSEIITEYGVSQLRVYESVEAFGYPTRPAWSSPQLAPGGALVGHAAVGDTDQDGAGEILFTKNNLLYIFENVADDSFAVVFSDTLGGRSYGEKVIGDLDGDGNIEIVVETLDGGIVQVFEGVSDNQWIETWRDTTRMVYPIGAEGGIDTDGNGTPEVFIMGNSGLGWTTFVYEPTVSNGFVRVDTLSFGGGVGQTFNSLGNIDGVGRFEYLMEGLNEIRVYRAAGYGQWEVVGILPDPGPMFIPTTQFLT